jgi:hypothetical protein
MTTKTAPVLKEKLVKAPKLATAGGSDVPLCWNCKHPLEGTKCPECGFDSSTIVNYHDL